MRRFRPCASRRADPVSAAAIPRSSPHRRSRVVDGPPGGQGPDRGTHRRSAETAPPGRELSGRANLPLSAKSEWPQPRASRNRVPPSFQAHGGGAGTRCSSRLVRAGAVRPFRPNPETRGTGRVGAGLEKRFPSTARVVSDCVGPRSTAAVPAAPEPAREPEAGYRSALVHCAFRARRRSGAADRGTTGPSSRCAPNTGPAAGLWPPADATRPAPPARRSDRGLGTQPVESALFGR